MWIKQVMLFIGREQTEIVILYRMDYRIYLITNARRILTYILERRLLGNNFEFNIYKEILECKEFCVTNRKNTVTILRQH